MLPAEIVRQVRRIQLATGRQVADVLAGAYVSVFKGRGVEFDEVRPYVPGDDVRTIDWNVTARVGAPYVKRYVEERQLTVMLLVDMSASLDFGSAHRSKREAAVELSALLAFSAIHNDDKVGLLSFHRNVDLYIPPRKGQKHALRVVREVLAHGEDDLDGARRERQQRTLAALPRHVGNHFVRLLRGRRRTARRGTDITAALEFCRRVLPRRAILFLISDFLDSGYLNALSSANRKHDIVAVRIVDPRESTVESSGLVTLEDAETGTRQLVDTRSPAFQTAMYTHTAERDAAFEREMRTIGIDLINIDAAQSVVAPLLRFFRMRERRVRR